MLIFGYISNFRDYFMVDTQMIIKTPLIEVSLLINTNVAYRCLKVCKLILLNLYKYPKSLQLDWFKKLPTCSGYFDRMVLRIQLWDDSP